MAVKIRLRRMGAKKAPFYRIVVADSRYPRDGRFIEEIGTYDPTRNPSAINVDLEKANKWIATGAQPTDTVRGLLKKAEADGIKLKIISAYRSFEYQQMLWEREVSHEMWGGLSYEKAVEKVGRTLALPGSSEHNTGLAVDLGREGDNDVSDDFYKTPESRWLCANAADFGFILRYPRLKEQMTGIDFEPWHYRYVGVEAARIIAAGGLCLE